jgi:hypothetical protein
VEKATTINISNHVCRITMDGKKLLKIFNAAALSKFESNSSYIKLEDI